MFKNSSLKFSDLMRIGLKEDASFKEALKVELSNQFIFIGLSITILHGIINVLFLYNFTDLMLTLNWLVILASGLLFNLYGQTYLARITLVWGGIISVFVIHLLFGPNMKMESFYILFLVTSTLFFDFSMMIKSVALVVILFIVATIYTSINQPILEELINPRGAITRFIFSVIMISTLISKLVFENISYNSIIRKQNDNLTEYNQQLKSFNYIISHDLKEPIRSIVGFSQLIKKDAHNNKPLEIEFLDHIIRSAKQLNKLLDDLVEFNDSTDKDFLKEEFKINDLINEIKAPLLELKGKQKIEIHCKEFPSIKSSRIAIFIILKNLIENGIKYNDKDKAKVFVDGTIQGGKAEIRISDNGIGIEQEFLNDVFLMFKRLNADYQKGSGLGLNIVKNLLKRLGGDIKIIDSQLNKGTTFLICFPAEVV